MANVVSQNRVRRKSYAGLENVLQKPKRFSYAGQTQAGKEHYARELASISEGGKARRSTPTSILLSSITSILQHSENTTVQSYQMKRDRRRSALDSGNNNLSFSQQSLLNVMDRFVKSVKNMEATVLVPSRLKDMDADSESIERQSIPNRQYKTNLFTFYSLLNDVRHELLWGPTHKTTSLLPPVMKDRPSTPTKHELLPEEKIMALGNTCLTPGKDIQGDIDIDSLGFSSLELASEDGIGTSGAQATCLTNSFRYHLQALQTILNQFSDSADYLSSRYQEEVGLDTST
ncbi:uncharacterized protein LOC111088385 [Limulus polyphemus]|uniref:Uncharacterized protein LOC111088385 n=1 Tax=Limulus polyphemus TaxID=6850 RepID=A0ABM1TDU5_LIMPO|nr:uncharacterized protein LOC111088385 [Limulus polyphemus]